MMRFVSPWFQTALSALRSSELRLWHMIVAFAATSFLSTYNANVATTRANLETRSEALVTSSSDFENNVHRYILSMNTFDDANEQYSARLDENVSSQISSLNAIRPLLSTGEQNELADRYLDNLVRVRRILSSGLNEENTVDFGVGALEIVAARDNLLSSLN